MDRVYVEKEVLCRGELLCTAIDLDAERCIWRKYMVEGTKVAELCFRKFKLRHGYIRAVST